MGKDKDVHTDRTCEAMSGWHSATAGSRVGATSILVAYGAALIGESGLAGKSSGERIWQFRGTPDCVPSPFGSGNARQVCFSAW